MKRLFRTLLSVWFENRPVMETRFRRRDSVLWPQRGWDHVCDSVQDVAWTRVSLNQRKMKMDSAARFRSSDLRVVFWFNGTGNTCAYFFPSFLPCVLSSLLGSSVRSLKGGRGRNGGGVETWASNISWLLQESRRHPSHVRCEFTFSRGRRGEFCETWPCSPTCCGLLDSWRSPWRTAGDLRRRRSVSSQQRNNGSHRRCRAESHRAAGRSTRASTGR